MMTTLSGLCAGALLFAVSATWLHAADLDAGRTIFNETAVPTCAICHTLADAGADGTIGPDLDTLDRTVEQIRATVANGVGVMPPFADSLTEAEIETVAAYVAAVAGQ